jgi:hypothetical protein
VPCPARRVAELEVCDQRREQQLERAAHDDGDVQSGRGQHAEGAVRGGRQLGGALEAQRGHARVVVVVVVVVVTPRAAVAQAAPEEQRVEQRNAPLVLLRAARCALRAARCALQAQASRRLVPGKVRAAVGVCTARFSGGQERVSIVRSSAARQTPRRPGYHCCAVRAQLPRPAQGKRVVRHRRRGGARVKRKVLRYRCAVRSASVLQLAGQPGAPTRGRGA